MMLSLTIEYLGGDLCMVLECNTVSWWAAEQLKTINAR